MWGDCCRGRDVKYSTILYGMIRYKTVRYDHSATGLYICCVYIYRDVIITSTPCHSITWSDRNAWMEGLRADVPTLVAEVLAATLGVPVFVKRFYYRCARCCGRWQ